MTSPKPRSRPRSRRREERRELKDRLIQTRVPEDLESALKDAARSRRLSVSHLIRNVLEDTFHLVDNVVAEVDNIVHDSVGLARHVRRDAERVGSSARNVERTPRETAAKAAEKPEPAAPAHATAVAPEQQDSALDHVLAWNKVVLNRDGSCAKCGKALTKGSDGHLGISTVPGSAPVWLCNTCL